MLSSFIKIFVGALISLSLASVASAKSLSTPKSQSASAPVSVPGFNIQQPPAKQREARRIEAMRDASRPATPPSTIPPAPNF